MRCSRMAPVFALACLGALGGAAQPPGGRAVWLSPAAAIRAAAARPEGFAGRFELTVRGLGEGSGDLRGHCFLYSGVDPRDPECLVVDLPPWTIEALRQRRIEPLTDFTRKTLRLTGTVRRLTLQPRRPDGSPSGPAFLQTHVRLDAPEQVQILTDLEPFHVPQTEPRR